MIDTTSWAATDGLGRRVPTFETVGEKRKNRFVGVFYWTWHADISRWNKTAPNNTQILEHASKTGTEPVWPKEVSYFWNEPVYGYYVTDDKWVLRRQAELLAAADVDVVIFDNTNETSTWKTSYDVLMETYAEARRDGVKTPQIAFILPFCGGENTNIQLRELYNDIYKPERYKDLWFLWDGKPLIMAHPEGLESCDKEISEFFTFKKNVPVYNGGDMSNDNWGWLSVYPQAIYYKDDKTPEQMTVGVAQNYSKERGLTAMNGVNVFGRTYTSKGYDMQENAVLYGANFSEQFEYALKVDPEFIFVTGWNEWVAGRFDQWEGVKNASPDQYNDEFSRDIEPSKGKLKDFYYYQFVSFVRRFKGAQKPPKAVKKTVDIYGDEAEWTGTAEYYSYTNNIFDRDHRGWGENYYKDNSGKNDIVRAFAAHDDENLYFSVVTQNEFIPDDEKGKMRLYIVTDGREYVFDKDSCEHFISNNSFRIKIPKKLLGIYEDSFEVDFKFADSCEPDEFYTKGDVAPTGRFYYRYIV